MSDPDFLREASHVVVTRFSVPRPNDPHHSTSHADGSWIEARLELFRRFFVPSVGRLGVPTVLLCSNASVSRVSEAVADLGWVTVVAQDDWYGGWAGTSKQTLTRMDSDDAVHERWFETVDGVTGDVEVCFTRDFLRYDMPSEKLSAYSRAVPSPLAAFRSGRNPYACDHAKLEKNYRVRHIEGAYLLQVFHGGNISTRRPSWYRRRLPLERLEPFGVRGCVSKSKGRAV